MPMRKIDELMYLAIPSRMSERAGEIREFAFREGYAPLCPFRTFPFEEFEANPEIGRDKAREWCFGLVDIGDVFGMFGISEGTIDEFERAYDLNKPIKLYFKKFDNLWEEYYNNLEKNQRKKLDEVIARQ